ncbi:hypothetical protein F9C11_11890 [Amycolatopsis sp. VS8301801F10]|uniref:hypothetical protein n=1 Tax=Amycolatopsis sp. VS8301801F10 TaxID=2652442 RepID=UPI0038FD3775
MIFLDQVPPVAKNGEEIFVYDLRSDKRLSLKANPLKREDLDEFVQEYRWHAKGKRSTLTATESARWRKFSREAVLESPDCSLDLGWSVTASKVEPALARLEAISDQIADQLKAALGHVRAAAGR